MKSLFSLEDAVRAFDDFGKPSAYIDPDLYEPERLDYEDMLEGKPRELLAVANFGTVAWGPLCYLTPQAMAYLLPRLIELASSHARDKWGELFMMRFILEVSDGPSSRRFSLLQPRHRAVIARFLKHLSDEYGELIQQECAYELLAAGLANWR